MATYKPKVKLDIDAGDALKELNKISKTVKELKSTVDKAMEIKTDSSNAKNSLEEVHREILKIDNDVKNLNKQKVNLDTSELIKALDTLGKKLESSLKKYGRDLATAFSTATEEARKMSNAVNNQHMSRKFNELKRTVQETVQEIGKLSGKKLDANTQQARQSFEALIEKVDEYVQRQRQVNNKQMTVNDGQAVKQITNLIRLVDTLRQKIDELSKKTLNVNVTNKGFDKMLEKANRYFNLMERTNKRILKLTSKEAEDTEETAKNTQQTAKNVNRLANYYAKAVLGAGKLKKTSESTTKTVNHTFGSVLLKGFYSVRGIASMFQEMQGFAYNIGQYITRAGQTITSVILPAAKTLLTQGFETANTLETAKIGWKLFFPNDNTDELKKEIRQRAVANSAFDAASMAKYASQFATLTKGDSKLALDAIEGIADLLMASGQEVSTYLDKVVTNTIQVVSYGKATARDWREFTQKMPIFENILKKIQPELAERMKDENAEITKEDTKYLLEAFQIVHNKSDISGVSGEYAKTYAGLKQIMQETIAGTMDDIIEGTGFFDEVKRWLKEADTVGELLNQTLTPLLQNLTSFMSKIKPEDIKAIIGDIVDIVKTTVKEIGEILGINGNTFSMANIRTAIKRVVQFIADFVKGWVQGIKSLMDFVKDMLKRFGINEADLGKVIGMLASPWGNFVSRALQALTGISQLAANLADIGKSMGKWLDGTAFGKWYQQSFAKTIAQGIGKFVKGGLLTAAGLVADDLVAGITGSSALGSLTGTGMGIAGGAIAGSTFGPIGSAIGAIGGGIITAVNNVWDTTKRIEDKVAQVNQDMKTEYTKLIEKYAPEVTKDVQKLVDERRKQLGLSGIDWNSDAGSYASSQIKEYLKNTPAALWSSAEMMKIAQQAYDYQTLRGIMDAYTETEAFRSLTGGGAFSLNNTALRDKFAKAIIGSKMLGANYDYSTDNYDQIIKDYTHGDTWSNDQVMSFIKQYAELEEQNKSIEEKFTEGLEQWNITMQQVDNNLGQVPAPLQALANGVGPLGDKMSSLRDEIGKLSKTIEESGLSIKYKSDLWGNVKQDGVGVSEGVKNVAGSVLAALLPIPTLLSGLFHKNGGIIKPVYKAHGGAIGVDTVPAMLQPGEYVVRSAVVNKVGMSAMNALNHGDTKLAASLMGRPAGNIAGSYNRNMNTNNSDNRKSIRNIVKIVNKNTASRLNSGYALANRLAMGF